MYLISFLLYATLSSAYIALDFCIQINSGLRNLIQRLDITVYQFFNFRLQKLSVSILTRNRPSYSKLIRIQLKLCVSYMCEDTTHTHEKYNFERICRYYINTKPTLLTKFCIWGYNVAGLFHKMSRLWMNVDFSASNANCYLRDLT